MLDLATTVVVKPRSNDIILPLQSSGTFGEQTGTTGALGTRSLK
jgi:hypothetical protein